MSSREQQNIAHVTRVAEENIRKCNAAEARAEKAEDRIVELERGWNRNEECAICGEKDHDDCFSGCCDCGIPLCNSCRWRCTEEELGHEETYCERCFHVRIVMREQHKRINKLETELDYCHTAACKELNEKDDEIVRLRKELKETTAACTWCVHCGETFDMHTAGPDALYEHVRTCDGHPMRDVEKKLARSEELLDSTSKQLKRTQDERDRHRDACQELENRVESLRYQRDKYMAQLALVGAQLGIWCEDPNEWLPPRTVRADINRLLVDVPEFVRVTVPKEYSHDYSVAHITFLNSEDGLSGLPLFECKELLCIPISKAGGQGDAVHPDPESEK